MSAARRTSPSPSYKSTEGWRRASPIYRSAASEATRRVSIVIRSLLHRQSLLVTHLAHQRVSRRAQSLTNSFAKTHLLTEWSDQECWVWMPSPTILAISCERWRCQSQRSRGRRPACGRSYRDRRQGGESWLLRHVADGQGRGATADVPGHPAADRPPAATADTTMRRSVMTRASDERKNMRLDDAPMRSEFVFQYSAANCCRPNFATAAALP